MAKKLSAEEKMAIVLEGLRKNKTITEICRERGISQRLYYNSDKGVIFVSDNESRSTSRRFMEECRVLGIKQVFTSYNNPKGNFNTERYFSTYKEEVVWSFEEMSYSELGAKAEEYE